MLDREVKTAVTPPRRRPLPEPEPGHGYEPSTVTGSRGRGAVGEPAACVRAISQVAEVEHA